METQKRRTKEERSTTSGFRSDCCLCGSSLILYKGQIFFWSSVECLLLCVCVARLVVFSEFASAQEG